MRTIPIAVALALAIAAPRVAAAQPEAAPSAQTVVPETRAVEEPVATPEAEPLTAPTHIDPGTHFILEMNLGSSFTGSVGFAEGDA